MKLPFLISLGLLAVAFAGCTGGGDEGPDPVLDAVALTDKTTNRENPSGAEFNRKGMDCGTNTRLMVEYQKGDNSEHDSSFTVNVYAPSSRTTTNNESDGVSGIQVFQMTFDGNSTGTYEEDMQYSAGTWVLETTRTIYHNGQFNAILQCLS